MPSPVFYPAVGETYTSANIIYHDNSVPRLILDAIGEKHTSVELVYHDNNAPRLTPDAIAGELSMASRITGHIPLSYDARWSSSVGSTRHACLFGLPLSHDNTLELAEVVWSTGPKSRKKGMPWYSLRGPKLQKAMPWYGVRSPMQEKRCLA